MTRKDFATIAEILGTENAKVPGCVTKHNLAFVMQLLAKTGRSFNPRKFMDAVGIAERAEIERQRAQNALGDAEGGSTP